MDTNLDAVAIEEFLRSLLDPEKYGHAVSAEVRDEARVLLGLNKVETIGVNYAVK
jgi:hypothetical protein